MFLNAYIRRVAARAAKCAGYTLVELSVSTSILALLAVGGLSIIQKKNEAESVRETERKIRSIRSALDKFIRINGYAPCPSNPALSEASAYFGKDIKPNPFGGGDIDIYNRETEECEADNITGDAGMLPVRVLNLTDDMAYDGWERKFTYKIASRAADKTAMADPSYRGNIRIVDLLGNNKTGIDNPPPNNQGALYVIISHGSNGREAAYPRIVGSADGAYTPDPDSIDTYERQNVNHIRSIYIQDRTQDGYDDIVRFGSKNSVTPPKQVYLPIALQADACSNARILKDTPELIEDLGFSNDGMKESIIAGAATLDILCAHKTKSAADSGGVSSAEGIAFWLDADAPLSDGSTPDNGVYTDWEGKYGVTAKKGSGTPTYGLDDNHQISGLPAFRTAAGGFEIDADLNGFNLMAGGYTAGAADGASSSSSGASGGGSPPEPAAQFAVIIALKTPPVLTGRQYIYGFDDEFSLFFDDDMLVAEYNGAVLSMENGALPGKVYTIGFSKGPLGQVLVLNAEKPYDAPGASPTIEAAEDKHYIGAHTYGNFQGRIGEIILLNRQPDAKRFYSTVASLDEKWRSNFQYNMHNPVECPYKGQKYISTSQDPERKCQCPEGEVLNSQMGNSNACIQQTTALHECVALNEHDLTSVEESIHDNNKTMMDPARISPLLLWLDAADCNRFQLTDNRQVEVWFDKSPNKNHFYMDDPARMPLYETLDASAGAKEEYGVVTFDINAAGDGTFLRNDGQCEGGAGACRPLNLTAPEHDPGNVKQTRELSVFVVAEIDETMNDEATTLIDSGHHSWGIKLNRYGEPFTYMRHKAQNGKYIETSVCASDKCNDDGVPRYGQYGNNFHIFQGFFKTEHRQGGGVSGDDRMDRHIENLRAVFNTGIADDDQDKELLRRNNGDFFQQISGKSDLRDYLNLDETDPVLDIFPGGGGNYLTTLGVTLKNDGNRIDGDRHFKGRIAEVIVYGKSLFNLNSDEQHDQLYRYLDCKWRSNCNRTYNLDD